jgi:hypothetical protein
MCKISKGGGSMDGTSMSLTQVSPSSFSQNRKKRYIALGDLEPALPNV